MSPDKIAALYAAAFHDAIARGMSETKADQIATQAAVKASAKIAWQPC